MATNQQNRFIFLEIQLTVSSFYSEPASKSFPKLMAGSPTNQEHFDSSIPDNAIPKMVDWGLVHFDHNGSFMYDEVNVDIYTPPAFQEGDDFLPVGEVYTIMHAEAEGMAERKIEWEHDWSDWTSKNSSASDISPVIWNISNLPDDAEPKVVAHGLVDYNGEKFQGDTAMNLDYSTPPVNQDRYSFLPPPYETFTPMHAEAEGGICPGDTAANLDFSTQPMNQDGFSFLPPPYEYFTPMHAEAEGGICPGDTAVNLDFSTPPMNQDGFSFLPPPYESFTPMHAEAEKGICPGDTAANLDFSTPPMNQDGFSLL